jgi:hypothetical protein
MNPNFAQEVGFLATLTAQKTIDLVANVSEGILVGTRRAAPVVNRQGEEVTVAQRIDVLLTNGTELQGQVAQNVTDAVLDFTAKKLSFTVKGLVEAQDRIELVSEGRRRGVINTIVGRASVKGTVSELNAITTSVGENLTAVQVDLSNVDTGALNDKKTFLMKLKHVKALSDNFSWVGTVPTLSSDKEASVEAVR